MYPPLEHTRSNLWRVPREPTNPPPQHPSGNLRRVPAEPELFGYYILLFRVLCLLSCGTETTIPLTGTATVEVNLTKFRDSYHDWSLTKHGGYHVDIQLYRTVATPALSANTCQGNHNGMDC